ncbi:MULTISPECIES: hypothetical protein [unclassified Mycobacterium]|uniref:hypothetical protein n=1 Tax=unclassified Mycobacterium TaxID=2642494 RepID=UPI0029C9A62D|nr:MULTISPECIES: hypothetical protein [unclassified Mycobacterium]
MKNVTRFLALWLLSACLIGAAAVGLAVTANAAATEPSGPGYSYSPGTYAKPAPTQQPGWHNHHGPQHLAGLNQR